MNTVILAIYSLNVLIPKMQQQSDHEKISQSTVVRIKQYKKETVLWYIATEECTNAVSVQKKLKTDEEIIVSENTIKWTLRHNRLRA
ncbi:19793_t:CDS:2 [Cetraspora pellucida]|uniref:19793_t:CDS:1 n=1 Tax=Cetraspora pellucida TaxID=1433469 RepID=A0A9N8ZRJ5_9GLOM|nr:19793_t:CDS:2 [Cetraspora pellucida]